MTTTKQEIGPMSEDEKRAQHDAHRDPISGRAGAHPVGTGVGAVAGGAAAGVMTGAAIGTVAGPVGTAVGTGVGAVVGAVVGGLAGKALAEEVNPTVEHGYWRAHYAHCSYAKAGMQYEELAPAYQFGWESRVLHPGKSFDQAESMMERDWDKAKGLSKLVWAEAKDAAHDAWIRISKARKEL